MNMLIMYMMKIMEMVMKVSLSNQLMMDIMKMTTETMKMIRKLLKMKIIEMKIMIKILNTITEIIKITI